MVINGDERKIDGLLMAFNVDEWMISGDYWMINGWLMAIDGD